MIASEDVRDEDETERIRREQDRTRDQEHDPSLAEHVPPGWLDAEVAEEYREAPLSFDALFGCDDERDPVPESCWVDPLQEAAAELALAQRRIDAVFSRFLAGLTEAEVDLLSAPDREVVRAFRSLPEREQEALRARFSDPRLGVSHLLHAPAPPRLRLVEPVAPRSDVGGAVAAKNKRTGQTLTESELARDWQAVMATGQGRSAPGDGQRRADALRNIARKNLGTVVTMERMLDDVAELRGVSRSSLEAFEPSSLRAVEPPSRGAGEPPSVRAAEPPSRGASEWPPIEPLLEAIFGSDTPELEPPPAAPLCWKESVHCASCDTPVPFELVAPAEVPGVATVTAQTRVCPCGTTLSVAYHWRKRRVVAIRMQRPRRQTEH